MKRKTLKTAVAGLFVLSMFLIYGGAAKVLAQSPEIFVQLGHSVSSLAITPDGKHVISGGGDHTLKLWDMASGREIRTLSGHKDGINCLAVSPDGRYVISASRRLSNSGKSLVLWEIETGREIRDFQPGYEVPALAFTPDGKYIVTGSSGSAWEDAKSMAVWDVVAGREIRKFGDSSSKNALAVTPDGRFVVANSGWKLKLWDIATGREVRTFQGEHASILTSIAVSPDGRYAVSGSWDKTLKLWDIATGREIRTMRGHKEKVLSVAFSPDGRHILSGPGAYDDVARLWSVDSGRLIRTFDVPENLMDTIPSLAVTPDGKYAVMGNRNGLLVWDMINPQMGYRTFRGYAKYVANVALSPDGQSVVSGGRLWDLSTCSLRRTYEGMSDSSRSVAVSPDGKYVFSQSGDMPLKLWEMETGKIVKEIQTRNLVDAAAFTPDGKFVLTGENDGTLKLWDVSRKSSGILAGDIVKGSAAEKAKLLPGDIIVSIDGVAMDTWSLFLSIIQTSPGKTLAFVVRRGNETFQANMAPAATTVEDRDGKKRTVGRVGITLGNEKSANVFQGHQKAIKSLAVSSDGRYAVSATGYDPAKLWDVETGKEIRTFLNINAILKKTENASLVDISQDGRRVITAGFAYNAPPIKLWDRATGEMIRSFGDASHSKSSWIWDLAFTPDGRFAVSAGGDNIIRLWDVDRGAEVRSFEGHGGAIRSIAVSRDGKRLLSASNDGTARLWDIATGREIAQFVSFWDGEWVVITPEGYFNASPGGAKHLNVRVGMNVYSIDNFYEKFFNPVHVASVLQGKKAEGLADIRQGIKPPPEVRIVSPKPNDSFNTDTITIKVAARDTGGGIDEIRLFHNGKALGDDQRGVKIVGVGAEKMRDFTVTLVDGLNTFRALGFSSDRTESNPYEMTVSLAAPSKDVSLYVFAVGINKYRNPALNLNYAVPDAKGIAGFFRQKGQLFKQVNIIEIYDEEATKEGILTRLRELEKTNPQDAVLIYLAGHGENVKDIWYFIPHELTYPEREEHVRTKGISSVELAAAMKNIRAQKILMLVDACKSGAVLVAFRGFEDRKALSQLSRSTGTHVVAASTKDQFAAEVKDLGHGVFTYTLLEGLKGKAAGSSDTVTVRRLMSYIEEQLPEVTKKYKQEAQFPVVDSRGMDFPLVIVK
ncbi:MAG: (Myosin heavy-chain) kinase [Syntrophaceae bacterium]|nr:MAG: (Myosin heavy-chain) kinase [Syntrophaceae bacterium]